MLGGYTALAESEWMGVAQASDVLEPLNVVAPRRRAIIPRLPRLRLAGLLRALAAVVALAIPALLGLIILGRPTISILFEHGRFDAAAGSLTYAVLIPYAVALPAYVATEVITRGLIALRDTRTPLLTNSAQFAGRAAIIALLLGSIGVLAIPVAFAATASVETVALGVVLLLKLQRRMRTEVAVAR